MKIIFHFRKLGSTLDCSSNVGHVELGDGIQKMESCFQDPNLLWLAKRKKNEKNRVDQTKCFSCLHHFL